MTVIAKTTTVPVPVSIAQEILSFFLQGENCQQDQWNQLLQQLGHAIGIPEDEQPDDICAIPLWWCDIVELFRALDQGESHWYQSGSNQIVTRTIQILEYWGFPVTLQQEEPTRRQWRKRAIPAVCPEEKIPEDFLLKDDQSGSPARLTAIAHSYNSYVYDDGC